MSRPFLAMTGTVWLSLIVQHVCASSAHPADLPRSNRIALLLYSTEENVSNPDSDLDRFRDFVADAASRANTPEAPCVLAPELRKKACTRTDEFLTFLSSPAVTKATTVICYMKIHGTVDKKGHHIFSLDPKPELDARPLRDSISRERIENALQTHARDSRPRLVVLLTDSCKQVPQKFGQFGGLSPSLQTSVFEDLFLKSTGFVSLNSCSDGQIAWMDNTGSLFNRVFRNSFSPVGPDGKALDLKALADSDRNGIVTWKEYVNYLQVPMQTAFKNFQTFHLSRYSADPTWLSAEVGADLKNSKAQNPQLLQPPD